MVEIADSLSSWEAIVQIIQIFISGKNSTSIFERILLGDLKSMTGSIGFGKENDNFVCWLNKESANSKNIMIFTLFAWYEKFKVKEGKREQNLSSSGKMLSSFKVLSTFPICFYFFRNNFRDNHHF